MSRGLSSNSLFKNRRNIHRKKFVMWHVLQHWHSNNPSPQADSAKLSPSLLNNSSKQTMPSKRTSPDATNATSTNESDKNSLPEEEVSDEEEELVAMCLEIIRAENRAANSLLQRRLKLGYTRAVRVMDILESRGIVGPKDGTNDREILVDLNEGFLDSDS